MSKNKTIDVKGMVISIYSQNEMDFISLTDMLKTRDGDLATESGFPLLNWAEKLRQSKP